MFTRIRQWLLSPWTKRAQRKQKEQERAERLEKLRKRDPFIYD
jgi:hypothetical protein